MKLSKFLIIIPLIVTAVALGACSKKNAFSLAQLNNEKTVEDCQALMAKKKYKQAIACFESVKSRNAGALSAIADISIADTYFNKKEYQVAADAYNTFIEANPLNEKVPYAYYKAGLAYLKLTPKAIDRDQTNLDMAIKALETVVKYYGGSPYAKVAMGDYETALKKQARTHFYVGRFYYKNKEYLAAVPRFQTIITEYPKLGFDEQSFYFLISALKKTGQTDLARKFYEVFVQHFPSSKHIKTLQ